MTKRLLLIALRVALVLLIVIVAAAGYELKENRRGPFPAPSELSRLDGRDLLRAVLEAHDARSWGRRATVNYQVETHSVVRPERDIDVTADPASRSADFRVSDDPGIVYHLDGGTRTVSPENGILSRELAQYGPSIVWWSMVPRVFADSDAEVWRIPDRRMEGETVQRLVVRWPGEVEWFLVHVDPDSTIRSIEFIDERFSLFMRWRARPGSPRVIDGVTTSSFWKFSPTHPLLRIFTGYRDLIVLTYRPIV